MALTPSSAASTLKPAISRLLLTLVSMSTESSTIRIIFAMIFALILRKISKSIRLLPVLEVITGHINGIFVT
jgi:hypothetical protein